MCFPQRGRVGNIEGYEEVSQEAEPAPQEHDGPPSVTTRGIRVLTKFSYFRVSPKKISEKTMR